MYGSAVLIHLYVLRQVVSLSTATAGLGAESHALVDALAIAHFNRVALVMPARDGWWMASEVGLVLTKSPTTATCALEH